MHIVKKGSSLEPGYVYAPYIPMQTSATVVSGYNSKNITRKKKINKIFNLGLDINEFSPSKLITSRYSTKTINSKYYGTVVLNNQA